MMTSMNISLPQSMRTYIENQVASGGYGNISEYFRELVRQDQKRKAEAELEAMLLKSLNSGEPIEVTPEYWERKKRTLAARLQEGET